MFSTSLGIFCAAFALLFMSANSAHAAYLTQEELDKYLSSEYYDPFYPQNFSGDKGSKKTIRGKYNLGTDEALTPKVQLRGKPSFTRYYHTRPPEYGPYGEGRAFNRYNPHWLKLQLGKVDGRRPADLPNINLVHRCQALVRAYDSAKGQAHYQDYPEQPEAKKAKSSQRPDYYTTPYQGSVIHSNAYHRSGHTFSNYRNRLGKTTLW